MIDKVRLIDANALKEDFMNDYHNYMMESFRGNYHDVIRITEVIERIEDAPTIDVVWGKRGIDNMDNIKQLEERIAQLTELVKSGSEAIESMKVALEAAEKERDRLADQRRENESKFKITQNEKYYFVTFHSRGYNLNVKSDVYVDALGDRLRVDQNNCFKTKERAEEVANKIKLLLELERFKSIYCPNDFPDWENLEKHYYKVYFNHRKGKWENTFDYSNEDMTAVYFPTKEIAQKVCEVLNEKERDDV